jgi:lipopolysaccharide/colanic/teichoic acid biosynthesis glycosyltransferase
MMHTDEMSTQLAAATVAPYTPIVVHETPAWKRTMDVLGAALGLAIFSPLMLLTAVVIKLTSEGPVVFKQLRAGAGGKPFTMYKFRSMYVWSEQRRQALLPFNEQTGPVFKMRNDPRITPFGRTIRRLSIDELPQLWNVLKGDMSLVGPRPLPCEEIPCGKNICRHEPRLCRLSVKPGLTCYWQVSGRSNVAFDQWLRMDMRYVAERSLLTDLRILLLTVPAVLSLRGAQ